MAKKHQESHNTAQAQLKAMRKQLKAANNKLKPLQAKLENVEYRLALSESENKHLKTVCTEYAKKYGSIYQQPNPYIEEDIQYPLEIAVADALAKIKSETDDMIANCLAGKPAGKSITSGEAINIKMQPFQDEMMDHKYMNVENIWKSAMPELKGDGKVFINTKPSSLFNDSYTEAGMASQPKYLPSYLKSIEWNEDAPYDEGESVWWDGAVWRATHPDDDFPYWKLLNVIDGSGGTPTPPWNPPVDPDNHPDVTTD